FPHRASRREVQVQLKGPPAKQLQPVGHAGGLFFIARIFPRQTQATKKRSQSPASSMSRFTAGSSAVGKSIDNSFLSRICDGSTTTVSSG
ncbi:MULTISPECIES: hypothetical protein, partial [unclassified Mesorhizobium]|uniref:hypothetical protein n=1 Tax=unclassified Mesorhizobium TaxID=325217 RepID=UPI0019CFE31A